MTTEDAPAEDSPTEDASAEAAPAEAEPADPGPAPRAPSRSLLRHSPFGLGFFGAAGAFLAWWLLEQLLSVGSVLMLVVVAMFLAAGLNPLVQRLERRGLGRGSSVLTVALGVVGALVLFLVAIVPVIGDQVAAITANAPGWLDRLQDNDLVQRVDERFDVIDRVRDYVTQGNFAGSVFGGVVGVGVAVLSALGNAFIVIVLTLYFLSSLEQTKAAIYRLAPASRRDRVARLGDEIVGNVGGYVAGAFVVASAAGVSSLIFLFIVGLGEYAVALAVVVAILDVIPMIGATIGAVIVTAIGFATDPKIGIACLIFYVIYQQVENYGIYPKVMSRSVDVPGAVTVIAALVGAALLGVIGALLAIPTAAAILLLTREIVVRRQDAR